MADTQGIRAGRAYVEIGASDSKLRDGLNAASAKLKAWGASLVGIGEGMVGFRKMIDDALTATVVSFRDTAAELRSLAAMTGLTGEKMSAMSYAATQLGGDADEMSRGMAHMARFMGEVRDAADGTVPAMRILERLGVTREQLLATQDMAEAYHLLGGATGRLGSQNERLEAGMAILGRRAISSMRVFTASAETYARLEDQGRSLGVVMSQDDVDAGRRLSEAWRQMDAVIKALVNTIGAALVPNMIGMFKIIQQGVQIALQWVNNNRAAVAILDKLSFYFLLAGGSVIVLGYGIRFVGGAFAGLYPLLRAAWIGFALTANSVLFLYYTLRDLALGALSAGMALGRLAYSALTPIVAASMQIGGAILQFLIAPFLYLASTLISVASLPVRFATAIASAMFSAAGSVMSAAVAIVSSIVGGIIPAFMSLGGILLLPITMLYNLGAAALAWVGAAISGATASAAMSAATAALGFTQSATGTATGFLASAFATLAPIIGIAVLATNAYTAAAATGATGTAFWAAVLTGMGLEAAVAAFIVTTLSSAYALYTGQTTLAGAASAIATAAFVAMGLSTASATAATTALGAVLTAVGGVLTGTVSIGTAWVTILTAIGVSQTAIAATTAFASGVWMAMGGALSWVWTQALAAASSIGLFSAAQAIASAIAPILSWMLGAMGVVIAGVTVETVAAEAITGVWVISLGLLAVAALLVAQALGVVGAMMLSWILIPGGIILGIAAAVLVVWNVLKAVVAYFPQVWEKVKAATAAAIKWVIARAEDIWVGMKMVWGKIMDAASAAWESIKTAAGQAFDYLSAKASEFAAGFAEVWQGVSDAVMGGEWLLALTVTWAGIKLLWVQVVNELKLVWLDFGYWLSDSLTSAWDGLYHTMRVGWIEIVAMARTAWAWATSLTQEGLDQSIAQINQDRQGQLNQAEAARSTGPDSTELERRHAEREAIQQQGATDEAQMRESLDAAMHAAAVANAERIRSQQNDLPDVSAGTLPSQGGTSVGTFSGQAAASQAGNAGIDRINENLGNTNGFLQQILGAVQNQQVGGIPVS